MADLAKLVDELSALTVMEAADLSKMLEEKWGVSAAAAVAIAAGGAAGAQHADVWLAAACAEFAEHWSPFHHGGGDVLGILRVLLPHSR